jgi:predicted RNA-binding Zn ribbon-like protein
VPRYPALRLPLPLELVNTTYASSGQPCDALATLDDLDDWLGVNADQFPGHPASATAHELERFRRLRDALRQLLGSIADGTTPPAGPIDLLNQLSAEAPQVARLEWRHSTPQLTMVEVANAGTSALATVTRAAIALLTGPDRDRIGRCQAPGCVLFFLKGGRRQQWCSGGCGNRARVARHYARHHGA